MKKLLKVLVGAIILFSISTNTAKAQDFTAVNSDGDTIYYYITSSTSPYTVAVTQGNVTGYYTGDINIPSTVSHNGTTYSVTSVGFYAFSNCGSLTSVTIPNSVIYIGNDIFDADTNLTAINVSSGNTNYSSINGVLYSKLQDTIICCPAGKQGSFTIPNSVTYISGAFYYCKSLTSITIPNSVTIIGGSALRSCINLTSITIPNSVTNIDVNAFEDCTGLTSLIIPNSVTSIGTTAFYGCSGLTSLIISNNLTSIGFGVFDGCSSLTSITIPNSVTSIGMHAFQDCSSLTSITIPNSVTSINENAFRACSSLTSITIPESVTSLGNVVFGDCTNLNRLIINRDTVEGITTIGTNAFYDLPIDAITIYVPCGSQTTYQTATNWSERSNYIRGLSNTLDTTVYICPGSSYQFGDSLLTTQGDYFDTVQSNSCYNPINLHLIISPTYNDTILATIHQGESYTFAGQQLTTAGIYYDSLQTVNGCDSIITLNLTLNSGLNEVNNDNISVSLYPNPTSNKATLSIEGLNENATLFIYDVQGREMMKKEINVGEKAVELNVKDFSKGVYNVRIVNNKDNTTKKLIIQ